MFSECYLFFYFFTRKLQLARYEWTVVNETNFDEKLDVLIDKMKDELKRREARDKEEVKKTSPKGYYQYIFTVIPVC